jgi:hypothetical protein
MRNVKKEKKEAYKGVLTWPELKKLIEDHAKKSCGLPISQELAVKINIKQLSEGSPAYSISRWEADVEIIIVDEADLFS